MLTRLYNKAVSEFPKSAQEEFGVFKTGDFTIDIRVTATKPYALTKCILQCHLSHCDALCVDTKRLPDRRIASKAWKVFKQCATPLSLA